MKHTKRLSIGLVGTVVIILAAGFLAAQQPPQKGEMKSMENMSMDKMMKECSEHHQSMTKSIDQMSKMMQDAKESNDPVKMRSAIDQSQKQLADMKEHMTMCTNMMNMMQKMQGMGGMKGSSK